MLEILEGLEFNLFVREEEFDAYKNYVKEYTIEFIKEQRQP